MKIAVVTGASSGIGRELVYAIDREKKLDEIWVIARRADRLEELRSKCRNQIRPLALDLVKDESIAAYQALLEKEQPEIHLLVNAAGFGVFGPFAESDLQKVLDSARLNALALTAMCHVSLPYMQKGDSIINMGSNSAWQPVPYQTVYGASKSYVLNFSRALGRELKKRKIHVMCVCPGWIKTEFQSVAEHDKYIRYVDRWYGPDEVAVQAMKDLKKKKTVSILGEPVRRQVRLVKFLPVRYVMDTWCRQQGFLAPFGSLHDAKQTERTLRTRRRRKETAPEEETLPSRGTPGVSCAAAPADGHAPSAPAGRFTGWVPTGYAGRKPRYDGDSAGSDRCAGTEHVRNPGDRGT